MCFVFLLNNFRNYCVLQTIFMPKSDATRSVYGVLLKIMLSCDTCCIYLSLCVLTACVLANKGVHYYKIYSTNLK